MAAGRSPLLLRQAIGKLAGEFLHRAEASTSTSLPQSLARQQLRRLQTQALPSDATAQARYLRDLNHSGQHEAVVQLFERGGAASSEGALGEYVKALVAVDRLDGSAVGRLMAEGAQARAAGAGAGLDFGAAASAASRQQASGWLGASSGAASAAIGSAKNPMHMTQAELPFRAQLWKTFRTLALTFVVISGIGALVDEQGGGITRGLMSNPDVRPQLETKTKFADVRGVDEAKAELEEIVEYLRNPSKFTRLGGKLPKGVLLVGPPGTGKTLLAKAVAGEAGVPFYYRAGSEFEEMFVGVGARRVRALFQVAKKKAPCIVFIDEIDAVGGSRKQWEGHAKKTLNQLLVEMDGFESNEGIIVLAATNLPESLDPALTRPGRFDRHVVVPNPDIRGRQEILELYLQDKPLSPDIDIPILARGTPGFSGADLHNLVNEAAVRAAKENAERLETHHLEYAKDKILMGTERKSMFLTEESRQLTAYHESGHAVVALKTQGANPIHKATITPRGETLGMVAQLPDKDETSLSKVQMLASLDVCMGGRVAEEMVFGPQSVTTGARGDLQKATNLARHMVCECGMSDEVGPVFVDSGSSVLSPSIRKQVDDEVVRLLKEAYERVKRLLKKHEKELHRLAKELMERETLTAKDIHQLMSPHSQGGGGGEELNLEVVEHGEFAVEAR